MGRKRERGVRGKPWYRAERDHWYVTINGKKEPLFDSKGIPVRGRDNRTAAERAWHEMVVLASVPDNYPAYFKSFNTRHPKLLVRDLRPAHVRDWWDACHPEWKSSIRNLSGSAFKAAFRWAAAPGKGGAIIPHNPLEGMALPTMKK